MDGSDTRPRGAPLILGIGCRQDADAGTVADAAFGLLQAWPGPLLCVATLDRRQQEPALQALARHLGVTLRAFPASALLPYERHLTHRSARVHALTGCWGVAESAALAAAGPGGRLLVPRQPRPALTLALATAAALPA